MEQTNEDNTRSFLREKFLKSLESCKVDLSNIEFSGIWKTIQDKYSGRAYHNLDHVKDCIDRIESLESIGFDDQTKGIMIIALIFHDIEQEEPYPVSDSLYFFERLFEDCIEPDIYSEIRNCILATDHFNNESFQPTIEACIVKDSDLAILGTLWFNNYLTYREQIMKKAKKLGMTEENYYIARKEFLIKMLAMPKIYQTWDFGSIYEWTARNNLQRELRIINNRKLD
jgi:predicted metal-dependent HD superfamily phosphohydrolase